jgi:hypothetical protein
MTSSGWIISHRCSWITVYVLYCNSQVNLIVILMTYTCIILYSLFCQLPNYNLFTQHVIYLYGETPLVNCGPWSILLHSYYRLLSTSIIYFLVNKYLLPHDTFNPLFTANRWTSLQVGAKYFGCVVCRFHVATSTKAMPHIGAINKLSGAVAKAS